MLGIASLVRMCWKLLVPELVVYLPTSLPLRLALWVSIAVSFLELLCGFGEGVVSARSMASSRVNNMAA